MSGITKNDLDQLEERLGLKIENQGTELRKEMSDQSAQLRGEIKAQGVELRKEIKESADSVLEVISKMAEVSSNQFLRVDQRFDNLQLELGAIRREINSLNNDIDRAFKAKTITEEETVALIAGQRRLDRWVDQIAKETGIKLSVN